MLTLPEHDACLCPELGTLHAGGFALAHPGSSAPCPWPWLRARSLHKQRRARWAGSCLSFEREQAKGELINSAESSFTFNN